MIPLSPMDSAGGSASSPGTSYLSPKNPVVRTHSNKSSTVGGNGNSGDKVGTVMFGYCDHAVKWKSGHNLFYH